MVSGNRLGEIKEKILAQLLQDKGDDGCGDNKEKLSLTPSQLLVILGLLGGVFEVTSLLVDKDQEVQIVLTGSLKRKTELDKKLDEIGSLPFDEVMGAIIGRFS
ncbi:MAG: hypothetical protein ACOY46_05585 [Bacillota bacterium]